MKSHVQSLVALLGSQALLLPIRTGTKKPSGKWRHLTIGDMANPKHIAKLSRAANIGVALGDASNGLCSIDIDNDALVEPFLEMNPFLRDTLCSKGARGCNFWVRITSEYKRTFHFNANGLRGGEFRSTGSYTVIHGKHPEGMDYRLIRETKPIETPFQSIKWFEETTPTPPPSTSSISLNPKSYILYDNAPPTQSDSLTRIKRCREVEASFKRCYPNLVWVYEVLIETRLKAIVGARNAFLVEAVPFLYRAVAPHFVLPLVEHFYQTNYWKFNDSLEQHLIEARSLLLGVAKSYRAELSEGERALYVLLSERHQNLLRICRDLAFRNEMVPRLSMCHRQSLAID